MSALPQAAYFLLLEAAVGGAIVLFWVHRRGEVSPGFTLFTGLCFLIVGGLAVWLRTAFPPLIVAEVHPQDVVWFAAERALTIAFCVLLVVYLIGFRGETWKGMTRLIGPLVPLVGLAGLWSAALVGASPQLFGLAAPLATLAGALALGAALTSLSLGHWYLVAPTLSVKPLIEVTLACFWVIVAQMVLVVAVFLVPGESQPGRLYTEYLPFFGVRVVFGLVVPLVVTLMAWRTARIRSLDSATGLLYIVAALVLAGEIAARTLYFLTGIAT